MFFLAKSLRLCDKNMEKKKLKNVFKNCVGAPLNVTNVTHFWKSFLMLWLGNFFFSEQTQTTL